MNRLVCAAALAACLIAGPATAQALTPQDPTQRQALTPRVIQGLSLDELFARLADEATGPMGERLEQEVLRRFSESGSDTADLLLTWAVAAIAEKNYPQALDVLDQIVAIKPDFAEAWNKRATVYFLMSDYGRSLGDIRVTLKLQPRHFGALAGLGVIFEQMDRKEEAIRAYRRALAIDPRLEDVKSSMEALEKEVGGADI